jgi:RNA polymerase sigma-70 factor, ECF subfamily
VSEPTSEAERRSREVAWLVLRAQSGDRAALESLLLAAEAQLRPYVTLMIGDADARDDVLQEVLLLLYRKLGTLRDPRAFGGWARRIASREIFRALRRLRHHERITEELDPELAAVPSEMVADPGLLARLPDLLEQVSPASRAVLALHYLDGLTLDEIAAILDLPVGTVKSRLAYGLTLLRRVLSSENRPT